MYIFQNYHRHSTYTNVRVSDSIVTNEDYAKRAKELGHGIICTMEHGYQGRYIEGYNLAKKYDLKFVFGAEAYWVKNRFEKDNSNCHICIFAKTENGRQAINDVLSEANLTGFYNQPRLDLELILSLPPKDVIVTSSCTAFWKYDDIENIVIKLKNHFGDNFYLEVQYHNTQKQIDLNDRILRLSQSLDIPIIMGCDSHYINQDEAQRRKDYLVSKEINYPDEEGWYLDYPNGDEAYQRFVTQGVLNHNQILEAMNNTNIFLSVEEYDNPIFNDEIKMPPHPKYANLSRKEKEKVYLDLIDKEWQEYKKQVPQSLWDKYEEEIKKETKTVIDTNASDYFLINYDVIKQGKKNGGKLTKSGRGSAVSFFTNKLLGFTEVDRITAPIKMYPERFMSVERILQSKSLPDIDFNVAKQEPFALAQKQVLGEENAYPMVSYGTVQVSAAWKLFAKAQNIPFEVANAVSEQIRKYEKDLKHADEEDRENIVIDDYIGSEYKSIFENSKDYRGVISSWSIAPCSYLLYEKNIRKNIGLVKVKENICCLMDGHWAEENHFLKNDLLKVSVVDLIYRVFERIGKEPLSVNELLEACTPNDSSWDIYKQGCCMGINQCERDGTRARVAKYQPNNISMLCAFIAAIRPGFKSMYKTFETKKPFSYGVKAFDNLIQTEEMPNSYVLYQEQEMAALNYAGISMSDCYTAIKNIAKKRKEKVLAYHDTFIEGFKKSIINDEYKTEKEAVELAEKLWGIIEDSASYSFNASHSYCVALDSLYGAYLKSKYPVEYYECLMKIQEEKKDKDKLNAVKSEAEDYFQIKFPPFRFGQDNREIKGNPRNNEIYNSLTSIKGFGKSVADVLYECSRQNFDDFFKVLTFLNEHSVKTSKIEPLIKIDYFSKYGNCRELLALNEFFDFFKQGKAKRIAKNNIKSEVLEKIIKKHSKETNANYEPTNMSSLLNDVYSEVKKMSLEDLPFKLKIANQKEILGYFDLVSNKEEDRQKLVVMSVVPLKSKENKKIWGYALFTKSIGSGKNGRLTLKTSIYKQDPVNELDIIDAKRISQNKAGYWYLLDYEKIC